MNLIELKFSITRSIEGKNRFLSCSGKIIVTVIDGCLAGHVIHVLHNRPTQCHSHHMLVSTGGRRPGLLSNEDKQKGSMGGKIWK